MTKNFIEITDQNGETFTIAKKHIFKVDFVDQTKLTRIYLNTAESQKDFPVVFTKELYKNFIDRLES